MQLNCLMPWSRLCNQIQQWCNSGICKEFISSKCSKILGLKFCREETESGDGERDSFSDSCSDESVSDKLWRWDGCSSEDGGSEQDSLWHVNNRLGYLYFQYFERSTPYGRVPLMDKVLFSYSLFVFVFSLSYALFFTDCIVTLLWFAFYLPSGFF